MHVLALMATGRFSHRIYVAYSILYCLGTVLSMQISFVGFQPVQSSEHMLVSFRIIYLHLPFFRPSNDEIYILDRKSMIHYEIIVKSESDYHTRTLKNDFPFFANSLI